MVLALSVGDPSGIGPDVALMAWQLRNERDVPPFILIADQKQIAARAKTLGFDVPVVVCEPSEAAAVFANALPILPKDQRRIDGSVWRRLEEDDGARQGAPAENAVPGQSRVPQRRSCSATWSYQAR